MIMRESEPIHDPRYPQLDLALKDLRKAEILWFRIKKNCATDLDKDEMSVRLSTAKTLFSGLPQEQAKTYLERIEALDKELKSMLTYDEALACLRKADKAISIYEKRSLYIAAESKFFLLGKFYDSEHFARSARQKYRATLVGKVSANSPLSFFNRVPIRDEDEPGVELKILLDGGYDLCLRRRTPLITQELHTTTIITPEGAFQLDAAKQTYNCVLSVAEMKELEFDSYMQRAKKLVDYPRMSIRTELTPAQVQRLDQALAAKGGRSLNNDSEQKPHFTVM